MAVLGSMDDAATQEGQSTGTRNWQTGSPGRALFVSAQILVPSANRRAAETGHCRKYCSPIHAHVGGVAAPQPAAAACPDSHNLTKQLRAQPPEATMLNGPVRISKTSKTLALTHPNGFWSLVSLAALGLPSWQRRAPLLPVPLEVRGLMGIRHGALATAVLQYSKRACSVPSSPAAVLRSDPNPAARLGSLSSFLFGWRS